VAQEKRIQYRFVITTTVSAMTCSIRSLKAFPGVEESLNCSLRAAHCGDRNECDLIPSERDCENKMITCKSEEAKYRVVISDGKHEVFADTIEANGGGNSAIRPHDLLEGALAACLNMTIRIQADKANIPLTGVTTKVSADRSQPGKTTFNYSVELYGPLTDEQREMLLRIDACPVKKTLASTVEFVMNS
jgi:putative redox protein